jgi:hypothetical protein
MLKQPVSRLALLVACFATISCGSPRNELNKVIKGYKFIPFDLPLSATRVGTIFRGNPSEMIPVTRPEKCFPDLPETQSLRWIQETNLPSEYRKFELNFNADLNNLITAGNLTLAIKASANWVHSVQLEFTGATVEYLDESNFFDFYNGAMSGTCKDYLSKLQFIGAGLRVQGMKFIFKDSAGASIDLTAKLSQIVDISAGASWHLENDYTLIIDTPKYIGYRMAKLDFSRATSSILYATSVTRDGRWDFQNPDLDKIRIMSNQYAAPAEILNGLY